MPIMTTLVNCFETGFFNNDICPAEPGFNCRLRFSKVSRSSITGLSHFFNAFNSRSCDYSIGGLLMWNDLFDYEIASFDSTLFIKGFDKESGLSLYYAPLGKMNINDALPLIKFDAANIDNKAVLISNIETNFENPESIVRETYGYFDKWMEYLYDIDKFIRFSGKKMEKKRNHLNYFLKHYPDYRLEPITPYNTAQLIDFTSQFEKTHIDSQLDFSLLNYESRKNREVLRHYGAFPFDGLAIIIDGKTAGFTFGEKIGDTFFVHAEKGDIAFPGIYQALASNMAQFVSHKYPDVKYLNREDDMGIDSLRKNKLSYHPSLLIYKKFLPLN